MMPTEDDILIINDYRDPYYQEAMDHANKICGWNYEDKRQHSKLEKKNANNN